MNKKLILAVSLFAVVAFGLPGAVGAASTKAVEKVTICHGTDSVKNPYVKESVDADAADGDTGNDNGKGDHSTHTGPVATSEAVAQDLKDDKKAWGDIIPPHHNYAGLNWTAEGQAVYNNDCNYATPGRGGETPVTPVTPTTPTTTVTPQVTVPAVPAVNAGGRGSAVPSIVALGGSLSALGYGVVRLRKFNA